MDDSIGRWLIAALTLAACARAEAPPPEMAGSPDTMETARGATNDGEIAAILATTNRAEIAQAELAQSRSTNADVRELAQHIITDHTNADTRQAELTSRMGVQPVESAVSERLRANGEAVIERLRSMEGEAFDREFVRVQVMQHEEVLRMLDEELIPSAASPEYRAFLEDLRASLEMHLDHARHAQSTVSGEIVSQR